MLYLQSLIFGLKRLYLQPRLCLPVIVSLGLTLAAVLVVLTICYSILIQPLPQVRQAEQLSVQQINLQFGSFNMGFIDKHRFVSLQRHFTHYGDWGYLSTSKEDNINVADQRFSATVFNTSNNLPALLGIPLLAGQTPEQASTEQQVWISESLWQKHFASKHNVIGQQLLLQNNTVVIAGVLPDFYAAPDNHQFVAEQVWQFFNPATTSAFSENATFGSNATIILRSDGQRPSAAELEQWLDNEKAQAPAALAPVFQMSGFNTSQQSYRQLILGDSQKLLWLLLAVSIGLFIIASLNLTNVLLAHYESRQHEFAVQTFTGCSSSKLRRLITLENLSLIIPAILLGLLATQWLMRLLPTLAGDAIPMTQSLSVNSATLVFVFILAVILLWLFSLPVHIKRTELTAKLNQSGKGNNKQQKAVLIKALLALQLTISSILITSTAALAWHSYKELFTGWGFSMVNSYQIQLSTKQPQTTLTNTAATLQEQQFALQLRSALQQHWPDAVLLKSQSQPISNMMSLGMLRPAESSVNIDHTFSIIDEIHFNIYGIKLLYGRHFVIDEEPQAVIIDLNFATLLQPDNPAAAVGMQLNSEKRNYQVVGVAANVKTSRAAIPHRYSPVTAADYVQPWQNQVLVLPPGQQLSEQDVVAALGELATGYNIQVHSLHDSWLTLTKQSRIYFYLICAISATTLLLALLGTAGVSQMRAQQRRYELAVRMATGASQQRLLWLLARESGILVLGGLALGALVTMLAYQQAQRSFSNLPEFNSSVFISLNLLLLTVAIITLLLPGWQVIRQDPMKTLRAL